MPDVITAINLQKKNQNRFNIFINGEYAFSLSRELAQTLNCGDPVDASRVEHLKQADAPARAFFRALYFLNFRPRSRIEVERYLDDKGFLKDAVRDALTRLEDLGYLNDHEFARMWIENRCRLNPKGAYVLREELRQKGIREKIIRELLVNLDERELAWKAAAPKLRRMKTLEKKEFIKKLGAFLSRRGFSYRICREICDQAWDHPYPAEFPDD
jgi:regulatory protein